MIEIRDRYMITENIRYNCKKFITYRFIIISKKDKIYILHSDINNNIGIF